MLICGLGRDASLSRSVQEAELEEIGLDYVHDRILLLTDRGGDGIQADRSATVFVDDRLEHAAVEVVQTERVNLQEVKRFFGNLRGDLPISADLGIVTDT